MSMNYRPVLRVEVALEKPPTPLYLHIAERATSAAIALRYQGFRAALAELFQPRQHETLFWFMDEDDTAVDVAVGSHTVNVRVSAEDGVTEYVYPLARVIDIRVEE